ncbi:hypothetical protein FH972_013462 [Carpinus fangiana]|uniref:FPL domain-containing protein n=1 Tax=Carpinus fangiana TaxID=176857 RepID=A0A5N6R729_9ROSI|nr:hypothetical protein FH972_013462 [Carpinus fangiana]
MFSNEHMNYLITYSFDFRNEELLSYYISFLRAISGKLNKDTISLLVKTQNDEVVSFPLYDEATQFAFHEENMVRTAVRALTLNVYHVGDDSLNRYVTSGIHTEYFSNLVTFFRKQCITLKGLVTDPVKNPGHDSTSTILASVDDIEDNLYYFSDVISAGIPDVGRLITDNILQLLIFPLLLPSLRIEPVSEIRVGAVTALYLICCILRIVKIKDLANTIAAALFFPLEAFTPNSEVKINGHMPSPGFIHESQPPGNEILTEADIACLRVNVPELSSPSHIHPEVVITQNDITGSHLALREALLSYLTSGDDILVLGSLAVLATLLQTKELDESVLDGLGILPQRRQHKKLLLQALVGEGLGEEQLFSSEDSTMRDGIGSELDGYLQKLKEQYGVSSSFSEVGASSRVHRFQVLYVSSIDFVHLVINFFFVKNQYNLRVLSRFFFWGTYSIRMRMNKLTRKDSYKNCTYPLQQEIRGVWPDLLITVLCDEWKKCKRAIEASSPRKEPKSILLSPQKYCSDDAIAAESSFTDGERMCESVKVFVLLHQLQLFSLGRALPDQPPICPPASSPESSRAKTACLDASGPKPGIELKLVDAVPCRIAFERGKERHFSFLALSMGASGWLVLAEESPLKQHFGVVRVSAPLAGSNPRIDDKHSRWLHLRIRPSALPFLDPVKSSAYGKVKTKALVDGRWTLAFRDEESCKNALSMVLEEAKLQSNEVERRLKPLFDLEKTVESSNSSVLLSEASSSSYITPSNSF